MNYLVLGGNGYLGSKIACELLENDHNVICTRRANSNLSRLENIKDRIKLIPASVDAIETAFKFENFDCVLNMVCNYGKDSTCSSPVIEANIGFPLRVLDKATECGVKEYLTIDTCLPDTLNIYSFSKKKFNEFGKYYVQERKINFTSLQLEMFYGSDEPRTRFIPSVIEKMLEGSEVNTTQGDQHRDIICIQDVIKAIMLVINAKLEGYHEIPVGTGTAPSISEIVDYIWVQTGKKSKINKGLIPARINEPSCVADTSALQKLGEWMPVPWKIGIKKMIEEMR